jgi:hypothetical protein
MFKLRDTTNEFRLNRLRDKKVSGKKLVSRIADTHGL